MLLVLLLAAAGLLLAPQAAASGALQALRACAARVIPTLLPFFVVSRMLTALPLPTPGRRADRLFRALFGVRAACLPALLTGLLGGYPAGAAAVTELYRAGALSKAEAERALCFCNNSGPGFFAGLIGAAVLGDVRRGLILYGLHAFAALMTGLLLPGSAPPAALRTVRREKPVLSSLLPEAVQGSCAALLQVSGLIVFFSSMLAVLQAAGLTALLPNRLAEALACGALELSSGILLLSGPGCARRVHHGVRAALVCNGDDQLIGAAQVRRVFRASPAVQLGLIGLPIFTEGGGLMYLAKPSCGFLLGLPLMAMVIGLLTRNLKASTLRGHAVRGMLRIALACVAGLAVLYLIGLPYMYFVLAGKWSIQKTIVSGCLIFLPFDALKIVVTTLLCVRLLPVLRRD